MTRQQKLAASEIKYQLNQVDMMPGVATNAERALVRDTMKAALIASFVEVFRYTCKNFDASKFRALCEGPFVPSVHDKLCMKKPLTRAQRIGSAYTNSR
jgi:hypothetical protein